jgi:phage tail-like protein
VRRDDWLTHQLPVGMLDDQFMHGFLEIFQTVSDTVLSQIDSLPHAFDTAVAPPDMVRLMGAWLGIDWIDPSLSIERQRAIVRKYADNLGMRGTKVGLTNILEVVTEGAAVTIDDNGGVFDAMGIEDEVPVFERPHVTIEIESRGGWATYDDLLRLVSQELPASVTFELTVAGHELWPSRDDSIADDEMYESAPQTPVGGDSDA